MSEPAARPTPRPRGLFCPACRSRRLRVVTLYSPCPLVRIRYRRCLDCACRVRTRETVTSWSYHVPGKGT